MKNLSILVVGAGFSGAVLCRVLADHGFNVDLIDKREHVAGNCYDFSSENDILIHKYGPHIFHTNDDEVVKFLSRFTEWIPYQHKVKALLENGSYVTFPVNKDTASVVGVNNINKTFFIPYSKKMWGLPPEELDGSILNRVSVRQDNNEYYFPQDRFQMLPKYGYTQLFQSMLDHRNITIALNEAFDKKLEQKYDFIFNSMPIDEYFDYQFGELPYRSIKFHSYTIPMPSILPVATVNFTNDSQYTRVTEWKKLPNSIWNDKNSFLTTLTFEEPCDYRLNNHERYYPVLDKSSLNKKLYDRYRTLVDRNLMLFIGRCGRYKYINMDQAVHESLKIAKDFIKATSS